MKVWGFILAVFIYCLLTSTINDMGILTVHEVEEFNQTAIESSSSDIKQVVTDDSELPTSQVSEALGIDLLGTAMRMFTALFNALYLTALVYMPLVKLGVPEPLALMLQAIVTFMEGIFIFQIWRRFRMEN